MKHQPEEQASIESGGPSGAGGTETTRAWDATDDDELSADTTFDLLKNRRRRDALALLRERGSEMTQGELAEHVAARENDVEHARVTSGERKRVYISLYQNHLPRLASADVIDYDPNRGTVALTERADDLFAVLDSLDSLEASTDGGRGDGPTVAAAVIGVNLFTVAAIAFRVTDPRLIALATGGLFTVVVTYSLRARRQ